MRTGCSAEDFSRLRHMHPKVLKNTLYTLNIGVSR